MEDEILRVERVTKSVHSTTVLDGVRLSLLRGEFLGMIGLNRSGKTTLMKVIAGFVSFEQGCVYYNGEKTKQNYTNKAVHYIGQESMLIPNMSVKDNICLANKKRHQLIVHKQDESKKVKELLHQLRLDIDPETEIEKLSYDNKIYVSICKALINNCKIIILDSICSVFNQKALEKLQGILMKLKEQKISVIYVNNKLDDVFKIMDRTVILKEGQIIWTLYKEEFSRSKIIKILAGYEIENDNEITGEYSKEQVLRVNNFTANGLFEDISFSVKKGEILGVAINEGNIRTALAEALFGLAKGVKGDIFVEGIPIKIKSPKTAIKAGLAFICGNSNDNELYNNLSLEENVIFLYENTHRFGIIRPRLRKYVANVFLKKINPVVSNKSIRQLNDTERLKVILQKWMVTKPKVAIVLDFTLGLDMVAKEEMYPAISKIAQQGVAVILISSYFPELIKLSDRILIIKNGLIKTQIHKEEALRLDSIKEKILASFIVE